MNSNVSVDLDDDESEQSRPVSAQLAVITDYLIEDAPFDALTMCGRLVKGAWEGAALIWDRFDDYLHNTPLEHRIHRSEKNAQAAGGKLPLGAWMELEKSKDARRRRAVAGLLSAVLVLVASCVASWTWTAAQTGIAILGPIALTLIGLHDKKLRWAVYAAPAPVAVAVVMGIESWRWWPIPAAVVAFLVVCEVVAWRTADVMEKPTVQDKEESRNWRLIWNTCEQRFAMNSVNAHKVSARPLLADSRDVGVAFRVQSPDPIKPDVIAAVERDLSLPRGGAVWVPDPHNAAQGELRLSWEDPYPSAAPMRREPGSVSYEDALHVANRDGNRPTRIGLNRMRVLVAGDSGSGKSTAVQELLDNVVDMFDADWSAIDVQQGPTFPPYARGKLAAANCTGYFTDLKDATQHLRDLRKLCKQRNKALEEGMDANEDGIIDPWFIVSERDGQRGHILFIDELSSATVDSTFAGELTLLLEVARKSSVSIVMATPDLDKDRVPRPVIDQANITIMFACPFSDAQQAFGVGSVKNGWEPFKLIPQSGDQDNDVGKAYIRGGGFNVPEIHKFLHMDKYEIAARNRYRKEWHDRFGRANGPEVEVDGNGEEIVDAEIVTEDDERRDAVLATALRLCGDREGLPAREANAEFDADSLAALRAAVTAKPVYLASEGKPVRAYPRPALIR